MTEDDEMATLDRFTRLTETDERQLVADVFADNILSRSIGVPPSIHARYDYRLCVAPADVGLTRDSFGDVDALLIESGQPARASAVEFKRVKISAATFETDQINKLKELGKGVWQANQLRAAGFAHVWLTVIIVTDLRPITKGKGFGFTPHALTQRVVEAIPLSKLAPGVGVTVCEITQVSDQPAHWRGGSGGQLVRHADKQAQPDALTSAIASLFSS